MQAVSAWVLSCKAKGLLGVASLGLFGVRHVEELQSLGFLDWKAGGVTKQRLDGVELQSSPGVAKPGVYFLPSVRRDATSPQAGVVTGGSDRVEHRPRNNLQRFAIKALTRTKRARIIAPWIRDNEFTLDRGMRSLIGEDHE